jgi:membrane-associated phospholipid phosphatase
MKFRHIIIGFVIAVPSTLLSYLLLDQRLAILIQELIQQHDVLKKVTSNIPDLLLLLVLAITALSWSRYYFLSSKGLHNRQTRFAQLCGVSVPLAYVAKALLQSAFGRVNPKIWLDNHELAGFHWFQILHGGYGFPSGHMTVFTALAVVFCCIYPRYRKIYLATLILLGAALVVTNYHFLSDVTFGAYLGLLICYLADSGLTAVSSSYRQAHQIADAVTVP